MDEPTVPNEFIPGTINVIASSTADTSGLLKRGEVVLDPQPTISPNDPLNWAPWRKGVFMAIIIFFTAFTNALAVVPDTPSNLLVDDISGLTWDGISNGDALYYTGMVVWLIVTAPSVYLYGSRMSYIFSALFGIAASVWYTQMRDSGDWLGVQFILGCSSAVMDAVVLHSMTHVFFQHELVIIVGVYAFLMYATVFIAALIGSFLVAKQSWQWIGWSCLIFECLCLVLIVFFLEESYFDRAHFRTQGADGRLDGMSANATSMITEYKIKDSEKRSEIADKDILPQFSYVSIQLPDVVHEEKRANPDPPRTYLQKMALITPAVNMRGWGIKQYFQRLWLMARVFAIPQVYFAGLQWGAQLAWLSFYKEFELDYWTSPPYNYTNIGTGLMNIPSLIGTLIGTVYSVISTYYAMVWSGNRNKGIQEAEVTLWCMLPALILSPLGLFLMGFGTSYEWSWPAPYVGLAFLGFGQSCSGDVATTYLLYCYPDMILENMIGVSVIYNVIALIFNFVTEPWLSAGVQNTTISVGVLDFFFIALMFPMIKWGKPARKWFSKLYFSFIQKRDSLHK